MESARDDGAPIEMLEAYFSAHSWTYEKVGEDEIVASMDGSWTKYELRAVWREDDRVLQFLALPDIKAIPEKRGPLYETTVDQLLQHGVHRLPCDERRPGQSRRRDARLAPQAVKAGVLRHREVQRSQRLLHTEMQERLCLFDRVPDLRIDHVSILTYSCM